MSTIATASYTQAKEFAIARGNQQHPFTLNQFMDEVHRMFYSHVDISFKDYFMELIDQEGQFVVHHSKLIEYGVMTSDRSSAVKTKLDSLGMVEGVDFTLQARLQRNNGRGSNVVNHYILTPESFKFCLARAQRSPGQPVDPVIYFRYFLLLEKMVKLFSLYESTKANAEIAASRRMLSERDQRIETMLADMQRRDEEAKQRDAEQQRKINELLGYAVETKEALAESNVKMSEIKDELVETKEELLETKEERDDFKEQFSLVVAQLDDMADKLDEAVYERDVINEKLDVVVAQNTEISEELTETKEQVALIANKLGITEILHQNAVLATEVMQTALIDQMTKSGAVSADPALRHVTCLMGRLRDGELELNLVARQIQSALPTIRTMSRDGYSPVIPMFFSVDPIALRGATAEKNKEVVFGMFERVTAAMRRAFGRTLQMFGTKTSKLVPAIGKQKTFIPLGCSFGQSNFLESLEAVLLETTGMKLSEAINLAKRDMEAMDFNNACRKKLPVREYDVDSDAL